MTNHQEIKLEDYTKPSHQIHGVELEFDLYEDHAIVTNKMDVESSDGNGDLFLDGKELELIELIVNDKKAEYELIDGGLILKGLISRSQIIIKTKIYPQKNTSCEGLYKSGSIFCTQCEAEGFRKITYYPDRPDVMSVFTTKIIANKKQYPYLLSNGNKTDHGDIDNERHFAVWNDPFKKPSYLFALVAGDLALKEDNFTTMSGREVKLQIFVDHGNLDKCDFAMESLKNSMKWDEQTFGLEYDLDIYMIVAVDSFNMGAMENKGLNIFNSVYVLAKKETAIDEEFLGVEGVIGHEYFHNWTGNRVTCRDWFQLTLKEGLTVFRDQEFSADMFDRTVQRIMDVTRLKEGQFPEDKGPMAHPIKPKSYIEINNFYTATIYEKGAEIIRMIHTLIGKENFRKGMDKYFELFDGQAVRTQDFVYAMEQASGVDLTQFQRWYDYAGTPTLNIKTQFEAGKFKINIAVDIPKNGNEKLELEPLHIPFCFSLNGKEHLIELKEWETEVEFQTEQNPVCEWNLDFSAPVYIIDDLGVSNLKEIVKKGSNPFSRWDAFQKIVFNNLRKSTDQNQLLFGDILEVLPSVLTSNLSHAVKAKILTLPRENQLNDQLDQIDPRFVSEWKTKLVEEISEKFQEQIIELYKESHSEDKAFDIKANSIGSRMLSGACLNYMTFQNPEIVYQHFDKATNMSDQFRSFKTIALSHHNKKTEVVQRFYDQWKGDGLVINKWLSTLVQEDSEDIIEKINKISNDAVFNWSEPNKIRAVFGTFAMRNFSQFHREDGKGYKLIIDVIEKLDKSNPQVGSRLATSFRDCSRLKVDQKNKVKTMLEDLSKNLVSPNCSEIVNKTLEALN